MKPSIFLCLLLLAFLAVGIFQFVVPFDTQWDEAVFIGMGKHIFSGGEAGLWEDARPLVLPLFLGFFWKIGLDPVLAGRILMLLFSVGAIYLTYLVAKEAFDEKTALLASVLFAFMPTFLFFTNHAMTAIPSTFFALAAVYLFLKKKLFLSGVFAGLAVMTRFFQVFVLIGLYLFVLIRAKRLKLSFRSIGLHLSGVLIFLVPFLAFNLFRYGDPLQPFFRQAYLTATTGWMFSQPFYYYLLELPKENLFLIFFLAGLVLVLAKRKFSTDAFLLSLVALMFLVPFSIAAHKEMRFALMFLPYLSMVAAYGIVCSLEKIKLKKTAYALVVLIFILQAGLQYRTDAVNAQISPFREYVESNSIEGGLWISNPIYIVGSDAKADNLIYYPTTTTEILSELEPSAAQHVLINTCDIPCPPWDAACPAALGGFIERLKSEHRLVFSDTFFACEHYIFSR